MTNSQINWDKYFIELAHFVSGKSKDTSTQVGAVIVGSRNEIISTGYNDFPIGVHDTDVDRRQRPTKYCYTEHAERNAIYNASRNGHATVNSTMYLNWQPECVCTDCARAIIQAGCIHVVGPSVTFPFNKDPEQHKISLQMFEEAGITLRTVSEIDELDTNKKFQRIN